MNNLYGFRQEYGSTKLVEEEVAKSPFHQFSAWFSDAESSTISLPNAMILATTDKSKMATSRFILLKLFDEHGFTFFTNYNSKKARQIAENPQGSLLFPWHEIERQVRIEGKIEKVSDDESDDYFSVRPEGSRIGAWASPQSEVIPSREYLEKIDSNFKKNFDAENIPRPPHWGGYRLVPQLFEFWQGRASRLHDRIEYYLEEDKWKIRRLAP